MTGVQRLRARAGIVLALLLFGNRAFAVDGFVLSIRYQANEHGNIHDGSRPGKLMRYDLKNDRVVSSKALSDKGDVTGACIGPFGDQVAVTKLNGTIAVMPGDGGPESELVRFLGDEQPGKDSPACTGVQWPAAEGGKWIYYLDARNNWANNSLRRVHVASKKDEQVVRFNRSAAAAFALSMDATPNSGHFIKRTDNYVIAIYDMSRGDGDMFNCVRTFGCGESISPDGSLLTANDGSHTVCRLVDMGGRERHSFRVSQWDGDPTQGKPREKMEWAWQSFRWSVNAMSWIAVTQGKLKAGSTHETYFQDAMLYDWIDKRQLNVTRNAPGTFDRVCGFWKIGGNEAFLGSFSGKAPLTVELNDSRLKGTIEWDFGDGRKVTAVACPPAHVYQKEGTYTLRGTRGDAVFQAQVQVLRRRPPAATCRYIGGTCLAVDFDEPVRGPRLQARLQSGVAVENTRLNETGRRLIVRLKEPLRGSDQLHLTGIEDLAQVPNTLPDKPLAAVVPTWPTNRAGLVFLWEDARAVNAVWDEKAGEVRQLRVGRDQGAAGIDRYGRMRLAGGRFATGFFSQANAQMQFRELILADALSLELTIQSADLKQKKPLYPARIVNCSAWFDWDWEFFLGQQEDRLLLSIRTSDNMLSEQGKRIPGDLHGRAPIYEIARLPDTLPHHLIVAYVPGRLVAYLDGRRVFETKEVTGSLKAWGYGELCFGDNHNGGRHQWLGRIEGVAIYKRFLDAAEAAGNYAAYWKKVAARKAPPQIEVQARLRAMSRIPELRQIAPYRDALVVNEYDVEKVLRIARQWRFAGKVEPGRKIRVAQWGLLDGVKTTLAEAKTGDECRLTLEAFANHPEKLDELEVSNSLEEDFETPWLYEPQP
ncbi:MAG: PKD domain-containing protein [Thermoguttaceae bacterium]|jgi:hypothetical protein